MEARPDTPAPPVEEFEGVLLEEDEAFEGEQEEGEEEEDEEPTAMGGVEDLPDLVPAAGDPSPFAFPFYPSPVPVPAAAAAAVAVVRDPAALVTSADIRAWRATVQADIKAQCAEAADAVLAEKPPLHYTDVMERLTQRVRNDPRAYRYEISLGSYSLSPSVLYEWADDYFGALKTKMAARYAPAFPDSSVTMALHDQILSMHPVAYFSLITAI